MSRILHRGAYSNQVRDIRRLLIGLVIVLTASVAWHNYRGPLLHALACRCLSSSYQEPFVLDVIRNQVAGVYLRSHIRYFDCCDYRRYEWFVCADWHTARHDGSWETINEYNRYLLDSNLTVRGDVAQFYCCHDSQIADADRDSLCEIVTMLYDSDREQYTDYTLLFIAARVHQEFNEVVWAAVIDYADHTSGNKVAKPVWQDVDEDGVDELVITTQAWVMIKQWEWELGPPENLAVYEWTAPGGILEPRSVSEELDLISWTPPDGKPLKVDPSADLQSVVLDLLEVDVSTNAVP